MPDGSSIAGHLLLSFVTDPSARRKRTPSRSIRSTVAVSLFTSPKPGSLRVSRHLVAGAKLYALARPPQDSVVLAIIETDVAPYPVDVRDCAFAASLDADGLAGP
ncbi:MAG: hypothetical protein M2R45_01550 [Verrucomicrobia subdivision 3 bacterium]|nr:hypothetical protein [Limisphaerales bacterium]MCS1413322.1 hypothetical protein [Limisphaerales bacterium]